MRRRTVIDWRFLVAFTFMLLVGYFVYVGIAAQHDAAAKGKRIDQLITLVQDQRATSKRAREDASSQRALLLDNQRRLVRQLGRLQDKQDALLTYLREAGVDVPLDFAPRDRSSPQGAATTPSPKPSGKPSKPRPPKPTKSGGGSSSNGGGTSGGGSQPPPSQPTPAPDPGICILVICVG